MYDSYEEIIVKEHIYLEGSALIAPEGLDARGFVFDNPMPITADAAKSFLFNFDVLWFGDQSSDFLSRIYCLLLQSDKRFPGRHL